MKTRLLQAAMAIAVLMAGQLHAAEKKIRITAIYSDLYFNQEGGDLLGTELFIVYADNNHYVAFVQNWQGGTDVPVVVPVQVDGDKISFTLPAPSLGEGEYRRRINPTGFDGTLRNRLASAWFR